MEQMTYATDPHDPDGLEASDESPDPPRRPALAASIFLGIALVIGGDVVVDAFEGGSILHLVVELAVMSAALLGAGLLFRDLLAARARSRGLARRLAQSHRDAERLQRDAERLQADALRYQEEVSTLSRGLGEAIDRQLDRWQLSAAEKEVAVLLLKGLSHKEVADVRGTSERTARGQARALYQKAGLDSRTALSAFFLEDLLPAR